jgi:hypothetical protein
LVSVTTSAASDGCSLRPKNPSTSSEDMFNAAWRTRSGHSSSSWDRVSNITSVAISAWSSTQVLSDPSDVRVLDLPFTALEDRLEHRFETLLELDTHRVIEPSQFS